MALHVRQRRSHLRLRRVWFKLLLFFLGVEILNYIFRWQACLHFRKILEEHVCGDVNDCPVNSCADFLLIEFTFSLSGRV